MMMMMTMMIAGAVMTVVMMISGDGDDDDGDGDDGWRSFLESRVAAILQSLGFCGHFSGPGWRSFFRPRVAVIFWGPGCGHYSGPRPGIAVIFQSPAHICSIGYTWNMLHMIHMRQSRKTVAHMFEASHTFGANLRALHLLYMTFRLRTIMVSADVAF